MMRPALVPLLLLLGVAAVAACGYTAPPTPGPGTAVLVTPAPPAAASPPPAPLPPGAVRPRGKHDCPGQHQVKGYRATHGVLAYALPGDDGYYDVKPTACFASERDAQQAGYRRTR